jgi:hypothetical protein
MPILFCSLWVVQLTKFSVPNLALKLHPGHFSAKQKNQRMKKEYFVFILIKSIYLDVYKKPCFWHDWVHILAIHIGIILTELIRTKAMHSVNIMEYLIKIGVENFFAILIPLCRDNFHNFEFYGNFCLLKIWILWEYFCKNIHVFSLQKCQNANFSLQNQTNYFNWGDFASIDVTSLQLNLP